MSCSTNAYKPNLEELRENVYTLKGIENSGTLHILYLDKLEDFPEDSPYESWEYVFNKMLEYIGIDADVYQLRKLYDEL